MRIRTIVVSLLIIAGLAYGGLKGYVYFKVKRQVDALISAAAPFADIQYGSIGSTLEGAVHISDIAVKPRAITDTVTIEQLRIITPGLQFLLNGSDSMRQGELPERLGLQLQGTRLKLEGSLVMLLEQTEAGATNKQPAPGDVCTLSRAFFTAQYRELGVKELVFDSDYMIERGATPTEMRMTMFFALRGIEQVDFTMTLEGIGSSIHSVANAVPLLKNMRATYTPNPEFANRMLEYCSKRSGIDVPTYIEQLFDISDDKYAEELGFIPGPGIRTALKQMVESQSELIAIANPVSPMDISTMHLYKPEDWPGLFGLALLVGDTAIDDLSFTMPKRVAKSKDAQTPWFNFPGLGGKTPAGAEAPDKKSALNKPVQKSPKPNTRPSYRIASTKEVHQLVGKEVRILTVDGKRREGRVLSVKNTLISLEKRTRGGTFSTEVYVGAIKKIEVLE